LNAANARKPLLQCADLRVGFNGRPILPSVDVTVNSGEFWVILGRNGCGKTTWLRTVLGVLPPVSGRVLRLEPNLRLHYLPQRVDLDELYPLSAREVVAMGRESGWSFLRPVFGGRGAAADRAIEEVGANGFARQTFRTLSEGQKQRLMFARLAASEADLAVLDEPTSAMDIVAEREAFKLLNELRSRHGMALLVVSHYLGVAHEFADRVLWLDRDLQLVVSGTANEVFEHPAFLERYGHTTQSVSHG
jgi:zinc transport system ATP-binding protein